MGLFKRKEKSVIPEPARPEYYKASPPAGGGASSQGNGRRAGKNDGGDDDDYRPPERRYGREAPTYRPPQTAGSYGSYGNYGAQQQQHQQPYGNGLGGSPGPSMTRGAYPGQEDARGELLKNARGPSSRTGAGFDEYAGVRRGQTLAGSRAAEHGDGPGGSQSAPYGEDLAEGDDNREQATEEDDEVEAIKQQIRFTKQESLATTRNAIRTARETEETASNTLTRLGEQTDRIANTELSLDKAKGYNSRAADGAKEIRRLNQSIFKPNFQFNKQAKRDAEDARILARHIEEKNDREEARQAAYESRMRVETGFREAERSGRGSGFLGKMGMGSNSGGGGDEAGFRGSGSGEPAPTGRVKWEQGGRYQFEASNSDDELEQELDTNLDEIAAITGRLKILATTAGKEIDAQNKHLDKIGGKVDNLDDKILMNTSYLKRIK